MSSGFLSTILVSLVVVVGIPSCHCQNDYQTCRQPFDCGSLTNLKYPFYGGSRPSSCGVPGFSLTCQGQGAPFINISSIIYRVLSINDQNQTLRVARNDLWSNVCAPSVVNITLENTPFTFDSTSVNISLIYRCTGPISAPTVLPHQFDCTTNGNGATSGLGFFIIESSSGTQVNVSSTGFTCTGPQITSRIDQAAALGLGTTPSPTLMQASLQNGFSIQWSAENQNCQSCVGSGGTCVFDQTTTSFACYCADGTLNSTCTSTSNQNDSNNKVSRSGEQEQIKVKMMKEQIVMGVAITEFWL